MTDKPPSLSDYERIVVKETYPPGAAPVREFIEPPDDVARNFDRYYDSVRVVLQGCDKLMLHGVLYRKESCRITISDGSDAYFKKVVYVKTRESASDVKEHAAGR